MTIKLAQEAKARAAKAAQESAWQAQHAAKVEPTPQNQVTLHLVKGDWVTGELVRETPQEVTLRWDYGEVVFRRSEIIRLQRYEGAQAPAAPQIEVNATTPLPLVPESAPEVTLHLKNGGVVSGTLSQETPESVLLRLDGGDVEFTRAEISRIERTVAE
jgi:hypothetical protein